MGTRFVPTKSKRGSNEEKKGDEWCKSDLGGDKMQDCIKFWNFRTGENFDCKKDAPKD